jgi:uncharacterized membrane protein
MRPLVVVGILLIALGAVILFKGLSYSSHRSELNVGEFQATFEEKRAIPAWVGGVALVGGVVIAVIGAGRRR